MGAQDSLVFPVLGVILSNALYFSPLPAVIQAARTSRLGSLNVLPQALMVVSTNAWMCYALSVPDMFIALSNLPGAAAAVGFVSITLPLIPRRDVRARQLVQVVLVVGTVAMLLLWSALVFGHVPASRRSFILGAYGSLTCVLLFASPLSTTGKVIATRNAASIYAPLTAMQVANCFMWTVYGSAISDVWVWGPNSIGLILGLVQLLLVCTYSSIPGKATEEHEQLKERDSNSPSDGEPSASP